MLYSNQVGGWSTEGLSLDTKRSNETSVTCLSTHLTSFAILVSIQDERPVRRYQMYFAACDAMHFSHLQLIKHYQSYHTLDVLYHYCASVLPSYFCHTQFIGKTLKYSELYNIYISLLDQKTR